jgi:hypothetical protein
MESALRRHQHRVLISVFVTYALPVSQAGATGERIGDLPHALSRTRRSGVPVGSVGATSNMQSSWLVGNERLSSASLRSSSD